MKVSIRTQRWLAPALLAVCLVFAVLSSASAEDKDFTGDHPVRVLKARAQTDNIRGGGAVSAKGNLTIWLQNPTSVIVDGIALDVELYNGNKRKVETLHREIDKLEPGEKKVITFRWDVVAENEVHPRFFIEYNARGNQKERFEGDTPSWQ